ncbi:MAG: hypothetical protein QM776_02460 [Rhodocyclaceae bacterium]
MNHFVPASSHPYASASYARALPHMGQPVAIPEWGTSLIARDIPGADGAQDAAGTYPICILAADADLAGGLQRLQRAGFVSVTLVIDDFHHPGQKALHEHFDLVRPFKSHYIADFRRGEPCTPSRHHRNEIRRSLRQVRTAPFTLGERMEEWLALYAQLGERHALSSLHRFPRTHFEMLATSDQFVSIGAFNTRDELLAAHIWAGDKGFWHSHLAASSAEGYACAAAYAVNDASIRYFSGECLVNLGGGAGHTEQSDDGLAMFKKGFANGTALSYLCCAVLDAKRYNALSGEHPAGSFFPAYRAPQSTPDEVKA